MTQFDYTIRESRRAKNVNLKMTALGGLEVVIPVGFDRSRIPAILDQKRSWIERTRHKLAEKRTFLAQQPALPGQISLQAIAEVWQVSYRAAPSGRITLSEEAPRQLVLAGQTEDTALTRRALRQWLAHKGKQHLIPWLAEIGRAEKLRFKKTIIRGQKTRWGSYSATGTISLNYKLLFLSPPLVRYVLIHELCHTKHLNHSKRFWHLVQQKEPNYKALRAELRQAWRYVPLWVEEG